MSQMDLLSWVAPDPYPAGGDTFDQSRDGARLNAQCQRVFSVMRDGQPRTLRMIAIHTGDPEASISARLRDLKRFGHDVCKEYIGCGLWTYWVKR